MFKLIVCTNLVGAIGKDNKLLYQIPNDMENFKRFTDNNTVIMGMNLYQIRNPLRIEPILSLRLIPSYVVKNLVIQVFISLIQLTVQLL